MRAELVRHVLPHVAWAGLDAGAGALTVCAGGAFARASASRAASTSRYPAPASPTASQPTKTLDRVVIASLRRQVFEEALASRLIQQSESVAYVREQIGHSSIQITVDISGDLVLLAELRRGAVERRFS